MVHSTTKYDFEDHIITQSNKTSANGLDSHHIQGDESNSRDRFLSELDKSQTGLTPKDSVSHKLAGSAGVAPTASRQGNHLSKSATGKKSDAPIPSKAGASLR